MAHTSTTNNATKIHNIYYYFIDGLIGAGKSTLLERFARSYRFGDVNVIFLPELVEEYNTYNGYNPLQLSYQDPWGSGAFTQLHIIREVNRQIRDSVERIYSNWENDASQKPLLVIGDRSIFSPLVFINSMESQGFLSAFTCKFLIDEAEREYTATMVKCNLQPVGMFYLHALPSVCKDRIIKRGRWYEQQITLTSLQVLENCYEKFMGWWVGCYGECSMKTGSSVLDLAEHMDMIVQQLAGTQGPHCSELVEGFDSC